MDPFLGEDASTPQNAMSVSKQICERNTFVIDRITVGRAGGQPH